MQQPPNAWYEPQMSNLCQVLQLKPPAFQDYLLGITSSPGWIGNTFFSLPIFINFLYFMLSNISLFTPPVNIYKNTVGGFRNKRSGLSITATSAVSLAELQTNIQYEVYKRNSMELQNNTLWFTWNNIERNKPSASNLEETLINENTFTPVLPKSSLSNTPW